MPTNASTATSYAALILADDGLAITAEKLQTLLAAAGIEDVEPIWTTLFAKALEGRNVKDLLVDIGCPVPNDTGQMIETEKGKGEGHDNGEGKPGSDDGGEDESDEDIIIGIGLFGEM